MNRTIGVWGISPHEEHLIKCLLQLLESRTKDDWSLSSAEHAQIIIVSANADSTPPNNAGTRHIVEYTADANHESEFTLHRPIRSSELLKLLNRLSDSLEPEHSSAAFGDKTRTHDADMQLGVPDTRTIIGRIREKLGISG